jgi:hypothetical protein
MARWQQRRRPSFRPSRGAAPETTTRELTEAERALVLIAAQG